MKKVGEKIKQLRKDKKLSLRDIANLLNIDPSTLARYERTNPPMKKLFKIAEVLGVPVEFFIDDAPSTPMLTPTESLIIAKFRTLGVRGTTCFLDFLDRELALSRAYK